MDENYNCKKCRDTGWACCLCLTCGLAYLGYQKAPHPDVRCECEKGKEEEKEALYQQTQEAMDQLTNNTQEVWIDWDGAL